MTQKTEAKQWTYQDDPDTGDRVVVDENYMVS